MVDSSFVLIVGAAVLFGAVVQSSVGMGLGLIVAPVVSLLDPALVPGTLLIVTGVLPMLTLAGEWRNIDWRGISWALAGRLVGIVGGVWVVATITPRALGAAVGVMVLIAMVLSTTQALRLRATPGTLSVAGVISGVSGTATSIGGPPIALVYQHASGPTVRATLGGYFLVGILCSLGALALGGQIHTREVVVGFSLLPFLVAGFALARPVRRFVDGRLLRAALLTVVTVSGIVLIVRALW